MTFSILNNICEPLKIHNIFATIYITYTIYLLKNEKIKLLFIIKFAFKLESFGRVLEFIGQIIEKFRENCIEAARVNGEERRVNAKNDIKRFVF